MNDNTTNRNSQFNIDDLIDGAVNNALVRRNETLLPLSDEEAKSISGGALDSFPTIHGVIIRPYPQPTPPTIHGVVIRPCPQPNPVPIIHGVIINPNPE